MTGKLKIITLIVLMALALILPAGAAYAAVDSYLVADANGVVYEYTVADLLDSFTNGTALWDDYCSKFPPVAVHDDVSGKYVDYNAVLDAYTNGMDITQYTESDSATDADLPETIQRVTMGSDGQLNFEETPVTKGVAGTVEKLENYPLLGSTTIRVTLSGTGSPQDYLVTVNGIALKYNSKNGYFEKALVCTDATARMSVEALQATLQIVTGTVTKEENVPLLGSTTIKVVLVGTQTPENYKVAIDGEAFVYDATNKLFWKVVVSSDALAVKTVAELTAAMVIQPK